MKGLPPDLRKKLQQQDKRLPKALEAIYAKDNKEHKYGAHRTTCLYGHDHDSKKESMWCVKLHELEKEGKISLLVREPVIILRVNSQQICLHYPDFMYFDEKKQKRVILDVKGVQLPEWKLKFKLCKAIHSDIEYVVV